MVVVASCFFCLIFKMATNTLRIRRPPCHHNVLRSITLSPASHFVTSNQAASELLYRAPIGSTAVKKCSTAVKQGIIIPSH